jgi:hypothetical protein
VDILEVFVVNCGKHKKDMRDFTIINGTNVRVFESLLKPVFLGLLK